MNRPKHTHKAEELDYPECSGIPSDCPENEGYGCCKTVRDECSAISTGHKFGPFGPDRSVQCEYCGDSP